MLIIEKYQFHWLDAKRKVGQWTAQWMAQEFRCIYMENRLSVNLEAISWVNSVMLQYVLIGPKVICG